MTNALLTAWLEQGRLPSCALEVLPGKRLSYQRHSRRDEHWTVVQGTASVTVAGQMIKLG